MNPLDPPIEGIAGGSASHRGGPREGRVPSFFASGDLCSAGRGHATAGAGRGPAGVGCAAASADRDPGAGGRVGAEWTSADAAGCFATRNSQAARSAGGASWDVVVDAGGRADSGASAALGVPRLRWRAFGMAGLAGPRGRRPSGANSRDRHELPSRAWLLPALQEDRASAASAGRAATRPFGDPAAVAGVGAEERLWPALHQGERTAAWALQCRGVAQHACVAGAASRGVAQAGVRRTARGGQGGKGEARGRDDLAGEWPERLGVGLRDPGSGRLPDGADAQREGATSGPWQGRRQRARRRRVSRVLQPASRAADVLGAPAARR